MTHINEESLLKAQMEMAIDGYLPSIIITLPTSWLLYFFLGHYSTVQPHYMIAWLTMQMLLCIIWLVLYLRYRHNFESIKSYWANWIKVPLNLFSGLGWGSIWILFVDPQNLITIVLPNVITSSALFIYVISTPLHQRATNTALIACVFPAIMTAYFFTNPIFKWLALGGIILLVSVYFFGLKLHELYLKMLLQIEEKRELVEALQREKQQVEQLALEKSHFLAATSHDLRQPTQAIKLFESVLMPLLNDPKHKEILSKIAQSNQSLIDLLNPLLELSKLESGSLQFHSKLIYIDDLFFLLQQQYTDLAARNKITLRCVSTSQQLLIDAKQLERILRNLIFNAIKHMKRSGKIVVGVRHKTAGLQIEVWDNGVGIPHTELEKIFQPFYQIDNPERHYRKGYGLGLSIVKQLVETMGGTLTVRSHINRGSCFAVYFPISSQVSEKLSPPEMTDKIAESDNFSKNYNVLVIEDDERIVESLTALLESWGLQVKTAHNYATALQILQDYSPHIIILDYQLPQEKSGLVVLERLRPNLIQNLPVVLLTGTTDQKSLAMFEALDFPILYKPIAPLKLKATLMQLLS
ncbi:MAG: hypothetical protein RIT27_985 [Pseudomonadota bacterium]|jgi:signal transduction histidine kinase